MPIKEATLSNLGPLEIPPGYPGRSASPGDQTAAVESIKIRPEASVRSVVEIVDGSQWNQLVVARSDYDLAQGWEWGEIQRDAGWTPYRYAVLAGEECIAAVCVAHRRLPGLPYSVLYACRGPLLDWRDERPWRGLLRPIQQLAHRHQAIFLRVSPSAAHDDVAARDALARHGFRPLPEDWTTWNAPRTVLTLSLEGDE
ncbi:MAG: peptidoglycan bridge formation glycyltransferase FemA/FemB family protein, partial [Candidatus Rokuibacteriota bacterium]